MRFFLIYFLVIIIFSCEEKKIEPIFIKKKCCRNFFLKKEYKVIDSGIYLMEDKISDSLILFNNKEYAQVEYYCYYLIGYIRYSNDTLFFLDSMNQNEQVVLTFSSSHITRVVNIKKSHLTVKLIETKFNKNINDFIYTYSFEYLPSLGEFYIADGYNPNYFVFSKKFGLIEIGKYFKNYGLKTTKFYPRYEKIDTGKLFF